MNFLTIKPHQNKKNCRLSKLFRTVFAAFSIVILLSTLPITSTIAHEGTFNNKLLEHESYTDFMKRRLKRCLVYGINFYKYAQEVTAVIDLNRDGTVNDVTTKVRVTKPVIPTLEYYTTRLEEALPKAINGCGPYSELPADKYEEWKTITVVY